MKPKVVLFDQCVTKSSPAGSCVLKIIEGLYDEFEFIVFSSEFDNPEPKKIRWIRIPLPSKPVILRYFVYQFLAFVAYNLFLVSNDHPDLIISTQGQYINCDVSYAHFCHRYYLGNQWKTVNKTGLRSWLRFLNHHFNSATEFLAFKRAKSIVTPSQGLADELTQTYSKTINNINEKGIIVANPVDISKYNKRVNFNRELILSEFDIDIDDEDLVLSFVALGDFSRKGLDVILNAMSYLVDCPLKLIVVGGKSSEIQTYLTKIESLNITEKVKFVGFKQDIRPYLWISNVFVFPSAYEVFPLVALQAAAAGLPIIATNVNGVREFVSDGINGWVIERDSESLVEVLRKILCDRSSILEMGEKARFSIEKYKVDSFINEWRKVLNRHLDK